MLGNDISVVQKRLPEGVGSTIYPVGKSKDLEIRAAAGKLGATSIEIQSDKSVAATLNEKRNEICGVDSHLHFPRRTPLSLYKEA